jgi:UDP-glucose 4-epimerase
MRVLITGGAGFIGSNLSRHLLNRGHEVTIYDDLSSGLHSNVHSEVNFLQGTLIDLPLLKKVVKNIDCVVHLGARGSVPRSIKNPIQTHEINSTGTLNVLEACREYGVRYIFSSSSSVYGANMALPKNEQMVLKPLTPYGASKMAGEALSLAYANSYSLPVTTFRFFNIFGPWQRPDHEYAAVIPKWIWQAMENKGITVFGDGNQTRDFTSVSTVVEIISISIEKSITHAEPINLAFGNRISLNQIILELKKYFPNLDVIYKEPRQGDIKDSQNEPTLIKNLFPEVIPKRFDEALFETKEWLSLNFKSIINGPKVAN